MNFHSLALSGLLALLAGAPSTEAFSAVAPKMSTDLNPPIPAAWKTPIDVGGTVPSMTFKTRVRIDPSQAENAENPFDWKDVTSEDIFAGKRIVIFSLPGAFTPL